MHCVLMPQEIVQPSVVPTYRHLKAIKGCPDIWYWAIVGATAFIIGELAVRLDGTSYLLRTRIAGALGIIFLPLGYLAFFDKLVPVLRALKPVLWHEEFDSWLVDRLCFIFTVRSWQSKVATGSVALAGILTVLQLGAPLHSRGLNVLVGSCFFFLLVVCGQGAHICLALLWLLHDVGKRTPDVPFCFIPHPAILDLQRYYNFVGMMLSIGYALLIFGIWQGPYGVVRLLQGWLAVLAFLPLSLFIWSFIQVHVLLRKIKYAHLASANVEVERAWQQVQTTRRLEDTELLLKNLDVQSRVQAAHEWPINFSGGVTLLIALLTAATQLIISLINRK